MKLSEHFSLLEFTQSKLALELSIPNNPTLTQIDNLTSLCMNILEPIRAHFNMPVTVNSGFRCVDLNTAMGGAATSQHLKGEAADIEISGVRNDDIWKFIVLNLNFDQVIAETLKETDGSAGWVHVSYSRLGKQRNESLSFLRKGVYVQGLQYA